MSLKKEHILIIMDELSNVNPLAPWSRSTKKFLRQLEEIDIELRFQIKDIEAKAAKRNHTRQVRAKRLSRPE